MSVVLQDFSWKRMIEAVEAVRERVRRATSALQLAGIPYAVAGGNAVERVPPLVQPTRCLILGLAMDSVDVRYSEIRWQGKDNVYGVSASGESGVWPLIPIGTSTTG